MPLNPALFLFTVISKKFLIFLFICVAVFSVASHVYGATDLTASLESNGSTTYLGIPEGNIGGSQCFKFFLYENSYNSTTTLFHEGATDCSWFNDPWEDWVVARAFYLQANFSSTTPTGDYWFSAETDLSGIPSDQVTDYYINFNWNGSTYSPILSSVLLTNNFISGFNATQQTRFTDLVISGTSTVNLNAEYFLEEDEINVLVSESNPNLVRYQYALRPSSTFSGQSETINALSFGTSTQSTNITGLADGVYDILITFSNVGCSLGLAPCPFPNSYVYTDMTISGGVLNATGTLDFYDSTSPSLESIYQECGITALSGCITNSFLFLFVPSEASLSNFSSIQTSLQTKFPFAYVYDFQESITDLYNSPTTTAIEITVPFATYGNITLMSAGLLSSVPFASTIKLILGYLMWIMFAYQMYARGLRVFNTNPQ